MGPYRPPTARKLIAEGGTRHDRGVPLRVGIIGAGAMGTTHARLLRDEVAGAEVVAVADADAGRARTLAEAGATPPASSRTACDLVADPDVDAVLVASPGDTHEDYVRACLAAGKPVLCEKPLATAADAARRVVDAEAAAGRRLVQVGFMRRFDPGYVALRDALDAGRVGPPVVVHSRPPQPLRAAGLRHGADPQGHASSTTSTSSASCSARRSCGATVHAGRPSAPRPGRRPGPESSWCCATDDGVVVDRRGVRQRAVRVRHPLRGRRRDRDARRSPAPPRAGRSGFEDRFAAAYTAELRAWVAAVASGAPAGASAWDGYAAAAVCEAALASLRSGGPVDVALGPVPDLYGGASAPPR